MAKKPTYSRRRPEGSALHQVVRDNLRTLYAAIEQGFAAALPGFVRDELEGYVDCGVLSRGFAVLACPECSERIVVGFSCKGLGFCNACLGRRMAQTAANLVEHVLPERAPLRQFVLTLPFELRAASPTTANCSARCAMRSSTRCSAGTGVTSKHVVSAAARAVPSPSYSA